MTWGVLTLPQVYVTGVLVALLVVRSLLQRRIAPTIIDDFVELVAFALGLVGVRVMIREAVRDGQHADVGFALMAASVMLAFVSLRGIWRVLFKKAESIGTTVVPKKDGVDDAAHVDLETK